MLPTPSVMVRLPVDALASSVLLATLVCRLKLPSAAFARPEPPSLAVQFTETSAACQAPSPLPQDTTGDFRSTMKVKPTLTQLVRLSHTDRVGVSALLVSVPAGTVVESEKEASAELARPDGSDAVQGTVTLSAYQIVRFGTVQLTVGALLSAGTMLNASLWLRSSARHRGAGAELIVGARPG